MIENYSSTRQKYSSTKNSSAFLLLQLSREMNKIRGNLEKRKAFKYFLFVVQRYI